MTVEDDTYSTIFTALKHPIRRNILRQLSASPVTYTELLNNLGIENGLLNYHLDSMRELVKKSEDGAYSLSEFGRAGLGLLRRVEEPINTQKERAHRNRTLLIHSLSILTIVALSLCTWFMYSSSQGLRVEVNEQQTKIDTLQSQLQVFQSLFDSDFNPPVSKIEAVAKAISIGGWNSSRLRGMAVEAKLYYVRFFVGDNGRLGFWLGDEVKEPVDDYSPRVENNVTRTDVYPPSKGTVWYRYVWHVVVYESGQLHSIPPPGYYYVDACTGEIIPHGILL